jgi:hypothetical protein
LFFGLDLYQDDETLIFDTVNVVKDFYRIDISNAVFDELHILDNNTATYDKTKKDWDYQTTLLAKFKNNLEAGSIDMGGIPIEYILFRKRRVDELVWHNIAMMPYDPQEKLYSVLDRLVQATEIYEYECVPLTAQVSGKPISATIEVDFDGTWITGENDQYQLLYNFSQGEIENVTETTVVQPMTQYPVVMSSPVDYIQSSVQSLVLSDSTVVTGKIDKRQERLLREKLFKFLKDKKPKIIRDSAGRFYLVSIIGNPREIPNNDLQGSIAEVSFQFIQIGDPYNNTTLEQSIFAFTPPVLIDGGFFNSSTPDTSTNIGYDGGDF